MSIKTKLSLIAGIALLGLLAACGPSGPSINVVNASGESICFLYVSPSTDGDWGNDELGSSILDNNETYTVSGLTNGSYDLKAELCDLTEITEMGFTVDGAETWTVTAP